jgi:hypothetical protein
VTDLDELRRIAYGRTTSPADEAAAADARIALAAHENEQQRAADLHAGDLRAAEVRDHPEHEPSDAARHDDPAAPEDGPGRLRRLVSSWRVWAVPACAAFVVGIALAGASVYLFSTTPPDDTNPGTVPDYALVDPYAEGTLAIPSGPAITGNLDAAEIALARPQSQGDALEVVDTLIDAGSVRLITSSGFVSVYAARSVDAQLCLVAIDTSQQMFDETSTAQTMVRNCAAPDVFAAQGVEVEVSDLAGRRARMHWDGSEVATTVMVTAD